MAGLLNDIQKSLVNYNGKWQEKKGVWEYSAVIAERKVFLSKKKLTYSMRLKPDEAARVVYFSEILNEAGSGLSTGGESDGGMSAGFGFKTETYNTFKGGGRQGSIEEQSRLFGKDYTYQFDYSAIRNQVKALVEQAGFRFEYQVLPVK